MRRLLVSAAALAVGVAACSPRMGDPRPVNVPTVAILAEAGADAAVVGAAIRETRPRVALVAGPLDPAWFTAVAVAAGLSNLSGPGELAPDLAVGFLGLEAVGDTTVELSYDGGSFRLHDALYDFGNRRFLDLMAFRVTDPATVRSLIGALNAYVATDVMPGAAVVFAVAVPDAAVGDSVARLLSPMYRGVTHCGASADAVQRSGIRLFFGPEARMYCRTAAATELPGGDRVHADLVAGRR
jgi:hypothetical protein